MANSKEDQFLIDFNRELPDKHDFLTNQNMEFADEIISKDIQESSQYLILTGYTSLSYLVNKLSSISPLPPLKIVLGNEPIYKSSDTKFLNRQHSLSDEIRDYWLEEGFSISLGGAVIKLIELIREQKVRFKILDNLHAKIYLGDHHAILGSSNFSLNGLKYQKEANRRVAKAQSEFDGITQIASYYEKQARDFDEQMIELLQLLLKRVSWQEALSRAVAEILEGDWMKKYPSIIDSINRFKLWPTQNASNWTGFVHI